MQPQPQFRAYQPQVQQRPPHPANPRRGGIGPMMSSAGPLHSVPLTPAQIAQQQQALATASELAKRRSRKPTDKTLAKGVEDCVIGDGVGLYKDLRDFERRLDATTTRKRLDIVDSVSRNSRAGFLWQAAPSIDSHGDTLKRHKTLRVWISNTVEDQVWQNNSIGDSFEFSGNMEGSYRVKIEGRLLDDDDVEGDGEQDDKKADGDPDRMDTDTASKSKPRYGPAKPGERYRFSHFFRGLSVDFLSEVRAYADQAVEWKKPDRAPTSSNLAPAADFDELTFKRNSDENMNIIINLFRHEDPERFELSPELAAIVDMKEASRPEVILGVWEYIKATGLQEDDEKRNFRCDELLRKIIGRDIGNIPQVPDYVAPHMKPLPPIKLAYTIRVDEEFHKDPQPTIYDIRVAVEDPLRATLVPFIQNTQYASMLKNVNTLDDKLAVLVQAISESKAKHNFLNSLSEDPATFVRHWLSSQKRDLEVIMGEASRGGDATGDEWRRGGKGSVWSSQNARESVKFLLSKQPALPR